MRAKRVVAALAAFLALVGPLAGGSGAQQRPTDEKGEVPVVVRNTAAPPSYVPQPWERTGRPMPGLDDAVVPATSEDDDQLRFVTGGELGTFRPAPPGGTPFFGSGVPIFGLAAPQVLPSRVLRPLGTGDAGDRFLSARPPLDPTTVIPKLAQTFDARRESFAFIGEIPPIPRERRGSETFPLADAVEADDTPGIRDNLGNGASRGDGPRRNGRPTTTLAPGPRPTSSLPATTTPATTAPPPGTTTSTATTAPRPTTTAPPTSSTSVPATTSTTAPPTTTTLPPTTSTTLPRTTTTIRDRDPEPSRGTTFVLGNQRNSAAFCFSNASGGTHEECDRLFDFGETGGTMKPGATYSVNLTLWNVRGRSDTDAVSLVAYAPSPCTPTPAAPGSAQDLCEHVQLTIERFSSAARTTPVGCVYGGAGAGASCAFSATRTLGDYGRRHGSMPDGARVVPGAFRVNDRAFLRISVRLPDRGIDGSSGIGRENPLSGQKATMAFRWAMQSA